MADKKEKRNVQRTIRIRNHDLLNPVSEYTSQSMKELSLGQNPKINSNAHIINRKRDRMNGSSIYSNAYTAGISKNKKGTYSHNTLSVDRSTRAYSSSKYDSKMQNKMKNMMSNSHLTKNTRNGSNRYAVSTTTAAGKHIRQNKKQINALDRNYKRLMQLNSTVAASKNHKNNMKLRNTFTDYTAG